MALGLPHPLLPADLRDSHLMASDLIRILGFGRNTIYRHIAVGNIKSLRFGRLILVPKEEVARIRAQGLPVLRNPLA
jgi:excisionase family DNA binding protein